MGEQAALERAFPGVEQSVTGSCWELRDTNERVALAISQRLNLPEIIGRVLAARGITLEEAEAFLNPTLRHFLPDPFHLLDMDIAADRLARAIIAREKIGIFGDYDVDGATSSALLTRFCRMVGAETLTHIPDRIEEGYGPNAPAMLKLKHAGASVIVTVDCGTVAYEAVAAAAEAGAEVVVIDHHLGAEELPDALAVVNPNRVDDPSPHGHLAAVGVTFLLLVAVNRMLKDRGWYATRREPDLRTLLDLVALGTVCDVVPLMGANRAFVSQGLKILSGRANAGLCALADVAGLNSRPSAYHLGFVLGPRINAGGRVGEASLGSRLLSLEDEVAAREIAARLEQHNAERKAIEAQVLEEAIVQVESREAIGPVVTAVGEGWHPGVIGIVAGRLKERYHMPVAVIAADQGLGKASCRSITGVDFGATVTAARQAGLLVAGGGHAMAAGFTVELAKLEALQAFFEDRLSAAVTTHGRVRRIRLDGALGINAVTPELVETLEQVGPFGSGNPQPRFVLTDVRVVKADIVGGSHVRAIVTDGGVGGRANGKRIKAMAFRAADTILGNTLLSAKGRPLHLAGTLRLNDWRGTPEAEFTIEDAAEAVG